MRILHPTSFILYLFHLFDFHSAPHLKHKVPAQPCGRAGTKWGMGVRHALFPVLALGAPQGGAASFPTLFSTASGVTGLVAGPSNASRRLDY
jgi:hypothetical protein